MYFPAVEDLQNARGIGGFDVVLVRSPDELVILLLRHKHPLAASAGALQPQRSAQLTAHILQFLHKPYRF